MEGSDAVDAGWPSRGLTRRAWIYAAPILLVAVALGQLYLAHTHDLSTWKGGGFGMFAAIDSPGERFVRASLTTVDGSEWLADVRALEERSSAARSVLVRAGTMPNEAALQRTGEMLRSATWVAGPEQPAPTAVPQRPIPAGADIEAPPTLDVVRVEVRVLRRSFDPATETVSVEELARLEVEGP